MIIPEEFYLISKKIPEKVLSFIFFLFKRDQIFYEKNEKKKFNELISKSNELFDQSL